MLGTRLGAREREASLRGGRFLGRDGYTEAVPPDFFVAEKLGRSAPLATSLS